MRHSHDNIGDLAERSAARARAGRSRCAEAKRRTSRWSAVHGVGVVMRCPTGSRFDGTNRGAAGRAVPFARRKRGRCRASARWA